MRSDGGEEGLQVAQVYFDDFLEEPVRAAGVGGEQQQEIVVAIIELPHLEQVSSEQAEDGAIGLSPELLGAFGKEGGPVRSGGDGAGRCADAGPHGIVQVIFKVLDVVLLGEGVIGLFEVKDAVGHAGVDAAGRGAEDPFAGTPFGSDPGGDQAGGAVGQGPFVPPAVVAGEGPAQFNGIDVEPLEDILVDHRQLLDGVVDPDGAFGQVEMAAEPTVSNRTDAGGTVAGEVDGNMVGFAVVERGENPFTRSHEQR